jgi:phage recombination protein Bet
MNSLTKYETGALALSEPELLNVLSSSLYPGAALESIKLVIGYCKAAGLDPMQKPVHIVPMWDAKAGRMRDVVMPGVNLYRTQASRSGQFAGMSEPEFGPTISENIGGQNITFPEWCRVTVKRALANGIVAEFTAREFWMENYAVKGGKEKSIAPNAMWMKRPRGQIAKCAAAQALRIAFPEIASQPTAEEMEGKPLQPDADGVIDVPTPPAELLTAARAAADKGRTTFADWWKAATPDQRGLLRGHISDLEQRVKQAEAPPPEVQPDPPPVADSFVTDMEEAERREHEDASS